MIYIFSLIAGRRPNINHNFIYSPTYPVNAHKTLVVLFIYTYIQYTIVHVHMNVTICISPAFHTARIPK